VSSVITNLLSSIPSFIEWLCGGHYVYNPTLKRFILFHFQFPFLVCGFRILHLFYLHFHSSNNPLRLNTNNKIPFFPFIFQKDFFGLILILCLYLLETHYGISSFSHPDNALEVCGLLTPLHIVPEWYFLCQYAILKAVPNKNAGFIILFSSISSFFFFGEIRNLTTFTRLNNNGFSLSSFFLSHLSFLWIGAQFPQEKVLSYGRILTLHYYFLLMCILFALLFGLLLRIRRIMILYFVLLMKSHLQSYPCPLQINSFWNLGFLLGITIILQIITGIFLGLHYTSDLYSAYSSIFFFIREIYYGWSLRYLHSSGASFVFLFLFLHLGRAISYGSYFYNPNTWFSGIFLFFFLMATAFMGYVLPFGQMSFWGATVITNLLTIQELS